MVTRVKDSDAPASMSRNDTLIGAGLTIGAALLVAAITIVGNGPVTKTIGLVMFPGVLAIGAQWIYVRRHSTLSKIVWLGGPLLVLCLIGLVSGLAANS